MRSTGRFLLSLIFTFLSSTATYAKVGQIGLIRQGNVYYPAIVVYEAEDGDSKRVVLAVSGLPPDIESEYIVGNKSFSAVNPKHIEEFMISLFVSYLPRNQQSGLTPAFQGPCALYYKGPDPENPFSCARTVELSGGSKNWLNIDGPTLPSIFTAGGISIDGSNSVSGLIMSGKANPPYLSFKFKYITQLVPALPFWETLSSDKQGTAIREGGFTKFLGWNAAYIELRHAEPSDLLLIETAQELQSLMDSGEYDRRVAALVNDYLSWSRKIEKPEEQTIITLNCTRIAFYGEDFGNVTYRISPTARALIGDHGIGMVDEVTENYFAWYYISGTNTLNRIRIDRNTGQHEIYNGKGKRIVTGACQKVVGKAF